jgi:pimeloyl-ACP methyl ester carboxylesterase
MNKITMTIDFEDKNYFKPVTRYSINVISCLLALFLTFGAIRAQADWPHVVPSKDGTPISFEIHGAGEPTLIFVHGWSCDARYWHAQLPHFAKNHRVVMLDLAGHGHSGMTRSQYTMRAFGEDVRVVTESTGNRRVILIGHSMGGSVIAEAARIMPNRVMVLIGIDTLETFLIDYPEADAILLYGGSEKLMVDGIICCPVDDFLLQLKPSHWPNGVNDAKTHA